MKLAILLYDAKSMLLFMEKPDKNKFVRPRSCVIATNVVQLLNIQWNLQITNTIGISSFVHYSEVLEVVPKMFPNAHHACR